MKLVVTISNGIIFSSIFITTLLIGFGCYSPLYKIQYEYMKKGIDFELSNFTAKTTYYYYDQYIEYNINPNLNIPLYNQIINLDYTSNIASSKLIKKSESFSSLLIKNQNQNKTSTISSTTTTATTKTYNNKNNYRFNTLINKLSTSSPLYQFLIIFSYLAKVILFLKIIPFVLIISKMSILSNFQNTQNQRNIRSLLNFSMVISQIGIIVCLFLMLFLILYIPKIFQEENQLYFNSTNSNNTIYNNNNTNNSNNRNHISPFDENFKFNTCITFEKELKFFGKCKTFNGKYFNLDENYNVYDYRWGPSKSFFLTLVVTIIDFLILCIFLRMFLIDSFLILSNNQNQNRPLGNGSYLHSRLQRYRNSNNNNNNNNNTIEMNNLPSKMVMFNIEIKSEKE